MNAETKQIVDLIRDCELREARRRLRVYAKTHRAARLAVRRLNNLIQGRIDDVQRSVAGVVALLWHEDLTGHDDDPRIASRYKGWFVASHGKAKGFVLHYGPAWHNSRYVKSQMTREATIRWALRHKHENPHYDEKATVAWLKANSWPQLIPMATLETKKTESWT